MMKEIKEVEIEKGQEETIAFFVPVDYVHTKIVEVKINFNKKFFRPDDIIRLRNGIAIGIKKVIKGYLNGDEKWLL